jgi:hypothetical protein
LRDIERQGGCFMVRGKSNFIHTDLSCRWLLTVVLKLFLTRELEDRFEPQSRSSNSIIAFGMSPFGVFPQVRNHGLKGLPILHRTDFNAF